jgi:hypothetical protein
VVAPVLKGVLKFAGIMNGAQYVMIVSERLMLWSHAGSFTAEQKVRTELYKTLFLTSPL